MKLSLVACSAMALSVALTLPASAQDKFGAALTGQVVWAADKVPENAELKVVKDENHCLAKGKIHAETYIINKDNKGVKNVFVWLAPATASSKMPVHPDLVDIKLKEVSIDQPQCAFTPHCLGMRQGQILVAKNSAPIAHNVKWEGNQLKNPGSNQIIGAGKELKIANLKADAEPVRINCNIHTWMSGYVRVFNHPYFCVTDADGKFEIKNPPAGDYNLIVWHEGVGWMGGAAGKAGKKITIKADGATDLGKLELKP